MDTSIVYITKNCELVVSGLNLTLSDVAYLVNHEKRLSNFSFKKNKNLEFKTQIVPIPISDINTTLTSIMYEHYHNTCKIIHVFYNTCIPLFKKTYTNYLYIINVK